MNDNNPRKLALTAICLSILSVITCAAGIIVFAKELLNPLVFIIITGICPIFGIILSITSDPIKNKLSVWAFITNGVLLGLYGYYAITIISITRILH